MADFLTTTQAARILEVHPDTLSRWADAGKISFWRTPGGQRRFSRDDVEALLEAAQPKAAS